MQRQFRLLAFLGSLTAAALALTFSTPAYAERVIGIGVQIRINPQLYPEVIGVLPTGPAATAGILPGDLILAVDGRVTRGQTLETVTAWLRGPGFVGSLITLEIFSPRHAMPRTLQLLRQVVGEDCLMEGSYRLRISGSIDSGWLYGNIGNQSVDWRIAFGRVSARAGGRYESLDIRAIPYSNELEVSGWIGATRVSWRSFAGMFTGYQPCIRP